jgi:Predicted permease.
MDAVFTYMLYGVSLGLLGLSYVKDKKKTAMSLKRAWRMFLNVLPQFLAILLLVGLLLAVLNPSTIQQIIGANSGLYGMLITALLGSVALVPAIIAFPITAELLRNGAGLMQIAVFISTLTTVGIVTLPLEIRYLGKKAALLRNILAFLFSFAVAAITGLVLS